MWTLDGKRIGSGRRLTWAPWPGRHELTLTGRDGATLQTVRFEVRGAGVKKTTAPSSQAAKIRSIATSMTMAHKL